MASGKRKEQSTRACGIVMTSMFWVHSISDVTTVHPQSIRIAHAKGDVSDLFGLAIATHLKLVGRDISLGWLRRTFLYENKRQIFIN